MWNRNQIFKSRWVEAVFCVVVALFCFALAAHADSKLSTSPFASPDQFFHKGAKYWLTADLDYKSPDKTETVIGYYVLPKTPEHEMPADRLIPILKESSLAWATEKEFKTTHGQTYSINDTETARCMIQRRFDLDANLDFNYVKNTELVFDESSSIPPAYIWPHIGYRDHGPDIDGRLPAETRAFQYSEFVLRFVNQSIHCIGHFYPFNLPKGKNQFEPPIDPAVGFVGYGRKESLIKTQEIKDLLNEVLGSEK